MLYIKLVNRIIKYFGDLSIKKKFSILMITTVIIAISIIGVSTFQLSNSILEETTIKSMTTLIELSSNKLNNSLETLDEISVMVLSNYDVQSILKDDLTLNEKLRVQERIYSTLNKHVMSNSKLDSIALYGFNENMYLFSPVTQIHSEQQDFVYFIKSSYYNDVVSLKGKSMWLKINQEEDSVSLARVVNILGTMKKIGVLCLNVNNSVFEDVAKTIDISGNGAFFIKDKNNALIYSQFENESILDHTHLYSFK